MSLGAGVGKEHRQVNERSGRRTRRQQADDGMIALKKRAAVFTEGAPCDGIWELIEGSVIVYKVLLGNRRQIIEIASAGCLLGPHGGDVYSSSAETLTRCTLRLHRPCDAGSTSLEARLAKNHLKRIGELQEHALLLGRKSALERVASFLLALPTLGAPYNKPNRGVEADAFVVALSQRDIGDYLGLKVETVCRTLVKLKRRMIIATEKRGHFRLLDRETLRKLAVAG